MDSREMTTSYRRSQWAQIIQERKASGTSVKEFCQNRGIGRHAYFYWQRKLREVAYQSLLPKESETRKNAVIPHGWALCEPAKEENLESGVSIEIGKCRVKINSEVSPELLGTICRVLASLC